MSKLSRFTQKVFGSIAGGNQMAEFGSLAAGTPLRFSGATISPSIVQNLSNYLTGWFGAVIGGNSPAIEDMNSLCYLFGYQLTYLMQEGVAEWDTDTIYYIGSIANDGIGNLYTSITDTNTGNPVSNTANWAPLLLLATWNSQTSSYALGGTDTNVGFTTGASAIVATLPTAIGIPGKEFVIEKVDVGIGSVQLNTTGAQTISGNASGALLLSTQFECVTLRSDGANWQIISHRCDTDWVTFPAVVVSSGGVDPGFGTNTSLATWRRVGKNMEIRWEYQQTTTGSAGTGSYLFKLPTGYLADAANFLALNNTGAALVGNVWMLFSSTPCFGIAALFDTSSVFMYASKTGPLLSWGAGSFAFNGSVNYNISLTMTVPIAGWFA